MMASYYYQISMILRISTYTHPFLHIISHLCRSGQGRRESMSEEEKKKCPRCGGVLSGIREDGKTRWQTCTGCRYRYMIKTEAEKELPQGCFDEMA